MDNNLSTKLERIDTATDQIRVKVSMPDATIEDVANAVDNLVAPTGTKNITQNGTSDVSTYASVNVQVPGPSGTINITTNGIKDVTNYATANVNVSGGGSSDIYKVTSVAALDNIQANVGDIGVVTTITKQPLDENFSGGSIIPMNKVTLTEAPEWNSLYIQGSNAQLMIDLYDGMCRVEYNTQSGGDDSVSYSTEDGFTYTLDNDPQMDWIIDDVEDIYYDALCAQFVRTGGGTFTGIYEYRDTNEWGYYSIGTNAKAINVFQDKKVYTNDGMIIGTYDTSMFPLASILRGVEEPNSLVVPEGTELANHLYIQTSNIPATNYVKNFQLGMYKDDSLTTHTYVGNLPSNVGQNWWASPVFNDGDLAFSCTIQYNSGTIILHMWSLSTLQELASTTISGVNYYIDTNSHRIFSPSGNFSNLRSISIYNYTDSSITLDKTITAPNTNVKYPSPCACYNNILYFCGHDSQNKVQVDRYDLVNSVWLSSITPSIKTLRGGLKQISGKYFWGIAGSTMTSYVIDIETFEVKSTYIDGFTRYGLDRVVFENGTGYANASSGSICKLRFNPDKLTVELVGFNDNTSTTVGATNNLNIAGLYNGVLYTREQTGSSTSTYVQKIYTFNNLTFPLFGDVSQDYTVLIDPEGGYQIELAGAGIYRLKDILSKTDTILKVYYYKQYGWTLIKDYTQN